MAFIGQLRVELTNGAGPYTKQSVRLKELNSNFSDRCTVILLVGVVPAIDVAVVDQSLIKLLQVIGTFALRFVRFVLTVAAHVALQVQRNALEDPGFVFKK